MHGLSTVATDKPEEWQIKTLGMAPFFGHNIFNNVVSLFESSDSLLSPQHPWSLQKQDCPKMIQLYLILPGDVGIWDL